MVLFCHCQTHHSMFFLLLETDKHITWFFILNNFNCISTKYSSLHIYSFLDLDMNLDSGKAPLTGENLHTQKIGLI